MYYEINLNLNFNFSQTHVNETKPGIKWSMIYCSTLIFSYWAKIFPSKFRFFPLSCLKRKDDDGMMLFSRGFAQSFPSFTWWLIDKSLDDTWSSIMARAKWWKLMSGILKSRNAQNFSSFSLFRLLSLPTFREEKWIIWREQINNEMALFLVMALVLEC